MNQRPLSPHLRIYRLPLTATLSILHRVSGVFLALGMVTAVVGLLAFSANPETLLPIRRALNTAFGAVLLWSWLYALFLHLCHGIRHLIWDTGRGFQRENLDRHAGLEVVGSLLLTGICYLLASFQV